MAVLTSKARNALPKSSFGEPGQRKYPMPDKAHAANAKSRVTQALASGNISPSAAAHVRAMANRKLGEKW